MKKNHTFDDGLILGIMLTSVVANNRRNKGRNLTSEELHKLRKLFSKKVTGKVQCKQFPRGISPLDINRMFRRRTMRENSRIIHKNADLFCSITI